MQVPASLTPEESFDLLKRIYELRSRVEVLDEKRREAHRVAAFADKEHAAAVAEMLKAACPPNDPLFDQLGKPEQNGEAAKRPPTPEETLAGQTLRRARKSRSRGH